MPTGESFAPDSVALVEALITMADRGSVELACLPHLRALHHELVTATPATGIDPDVQAVWRMLFSGAMAMLPALSASAMVHPDAERLYSALLILVESMTRGETDMHAETMRVLNGVRERDDVVRAMIAAAHARDQVAIAAGVEVAHDPALVAEIEAADRIDVGAFSVPLPLSARPDSSSYYVRGTLDHLAAFYTCWAQRNGWLFEMVLDNNRWKSISFRRDRWTFELRITTWIYGENALNFDWPAGVTATLILNAVPTPSLPAVTRARPQVPGGAMRAPLGEVDALLADGGLVFAAKDGAVWLIDPVARTSTLLAEMMRGTDRMSVHGLAADGRDVLVRTFIPSAIWRIDPVTGTRTEVQLYLNGYVRAFAYLDQTGYFAYEDGRVMAIVLASRDATELGQFPEARALCARDGVLYVAADRAVHSIDLATGATRDLAELPQRAVGLASDGTCVYTLHGGGIGRLDLATRSWTQIAGMPDLGAGNLLARGIDSMLSADNPPPDGIADRAIIDSARHISYDAGGLWFSDRGRLRRLALAERHVMTLEL